MNVWFKILMLENKVIYVIIAENYIINFHIIHLNQNFCALVI